MFNFFWNIFGTFGRFFFKDIFLKKMFFEIFFEKNIFGVSAADTRLGRVRRPKGTMGGDPLLICCTASLPVASPALLRGHILVKPMFQQDWNIRDISPSGRR